MSYLKPYRPPVALKSGAGENSGGGRKPWARRPPPKLCTSSFLSGGWKAPRAVTLPRQPSAPRAPASGGRMAKRCREALAAAVSPLSEDGSADDASGTSTAADSALEAAVARDAAELDETDGVDEVDYSDVRMDEAAEAAARAAKRRRGPEPAPVKNCAALLASHASTTDDDCDRRSSCASSVGGGTVLLADLDRAAEPATVVTAEPAPVEPEPEAEAEAVPEPEPMAVEPAAEPETAEPEPEPEAPAAPAPEPEAPEAAAAAAAGDSPEDAAACLVAMDGVLKRAPASPTSVEGYLLRHKHAAWFLEPVDPVGMGIEHYPEIIKHPMDLGTIKGRYKGGAYATAAAFYTDVRLVFSNATTFNKDPDEPVHQAAVALGAKFEERFADAIEEACEASDDEDEEHPDLGRVAVHKFAGYGKYTGKVVAGDLSAKTLTIKWDQEAEPKTYPATKAGRWLLARL